MAVRKSISKTVRFEVFKRDLFTCQYCGRKSPDVILEADHIVSVKNNGANDIINLITSCYDCNRGKGHKALNDLSLIDKQRKQIEELQERKNQIEMLLEWKMSLSNIDEGLTDKVVKYFNSKFNGWLLNESGEKWLRGYIKKYGYTNVIESIDESYKLYFNPDSEDGNFEFVLKRVKSILHYKSLSPDEKKIQDRRVNVFRRCRLRFYKDFEYKEACATVNNYLDGSDGDLTHLEIVTEEADNFFEWKKLLQI